MYKQLPFIAYFLQTKKEPRVKNYPRNLLITGGRFFYLMTLLLPGNYFKSSAEIKPSMGLDNLKNLPKNLETIYLTTESYIHEVQKYLFIKGVEIIKC